MPPNPSRNSAYRARRYEDIPPSDDLDVIAEEPEAEADESRPNRRRLLIGAGVVAVVLCLLLVACYFAYTFVRGNFGAGNIPLFPTDRPTVTPAFAVGTEPPPSPTLEPTQTSTETVTPIPIRYAALSEIAGEVQVRLSQEAEWVAVTADTAIAPGATVLTGQNSRVKITLAEGNIIRLSSQTQFTLLEAGGSDADPIDRMQLEFGKVWAIVLAPLGNGLFEIQLPVGLAAVRGSFMSAEYNSTSNGIVVSCLEGSCHYENTNGAADLITGQQVVSVNGEAPRAQPISVYQLNDWNPQNVPEVARLTPTATPTLPPTDTPPASPTNTLTPSRTPRPSNTLRPSRTPTQTRTAKPSPSATATTTITPTIGPSPTAGAPAKLAFTLQPAGSPMGIAFSVQVAIQDANGITVPNATGAVSVAIGVNGGGGSLAGVTTVGPVNGIASFQLSIDKPGSYTLVATSPGLASATSAAFNITGSTALLFVISGLPPDVTAGQAITITVTAIEADGSVSTTHTGVVRFQSSDGQAVLPADYTFTTDDRGSHTFLVTFNTQGSQTLKVFDINNPTLAGYAGTNVK